MPITLRTPCKKHLVHFSTANPPMLSQTRRFRLGNRKSRWTLTPATISACSSSRFGDAHVVGRMTGRSIRARMFEKLSKENHLDGSGSGSSQIGVPDVGWVSELVSR
uniref:Uncharacterized protein n=1 Tax=Glycine max TaxID=3847 RepID=C6TL47_SOYBN|nr:unknown [Glycine max]